MIFFEMLGSCISKRAFGHVDGVFFCPSMDLVAVLSSGLSVFRLNWQKLFSVSLESAVQIAWNPDGRLLHVLTNELSTFLTETGECVKLKRPMDGALFFSQTQLVFSEIPSFSTEDMIEVQVVAFQDACEISLTGGSDGCWFRAVVLGRVHCSNLKRAWLSADLSHLLLVAHQNDTVKVFKQVCLVFFFLSFRSLFCFATVDVC
jgi:hypothetical protein